MKYLLSASLLSAVFVAAAPSLVLDVAGPPSIVDIRSLEVITKVTNVGSEPVKLLKDPNSVLSTLQTHTFTINSASGSPSFTGIKVKYSSTKSSQSDNGFIVLAPGQSVQKVHSLAGAYNFTQSGQGHYTFGASNVFRYIDSSGSLQRTKASSNTHQFTISGLLAVPRTTSLRPSRLSKREIAFNECSAEQRTTIMEAAIASNVYVTEARTDLASGDRSQFIKWFGEYDEKRFETVKEHFELIGNHATEDTTYDCSCPDPPSDEELYAYVQPEMTGRIYLCSLFWNAPLTGPDSQAGTIVHENSHFTKYGDTMDFEYGQANCMKLAEENPDQAVMNADNHEYFVETLGQLTSPAA